MLKKTIKHSILLYLVILLTQLQTSLAKPPIFLDKAEDALILSESIEVDALLIFTADWCQACVVLKNDINTNLEIVEDTIVCYIDFDKRADLVQEFKVKNIPDCIIYRKNKEIKRRVGYKSKKEFELWLKK